MRMRRTAARLIGPVAAAATIAVLPLLPASAAATPTDRDAAFGQGGLTLTEFGPRGELEDETLRHEATAVTVQADGTIVVAGPLLDGIGVARYEADGSHDEDFGQDGLVVIEQQTTAPEVGDVAVAPTGEIVVAGATGDMDSEFLVARLLPDGSLDESLAGDGTATADLTGFDRARSLVLLPRGRMLLAGDTRPDVAGSSERQYAMVMFRRNGSTSRRIGDDGVVIGPPSTAFTDVVVTARRAIVGAGGESLFAFDRTGSPNASFGSGGTAAVSHSVSALVIDSTRRIVAGGGDTPYDMQISRFSKTGVPDEDFNVNADQVIFDFPGVRHVSLHDMAIDEEGRVVATGHYAASRSGGDRTAIARFLSDGTPDPAFGTRGGFVDGGLREGNGVAIQADGKILVAGEPHGSFDFGALRLTG